MNGKNSILIISLAAILISGCGDPYSKDFQLTTINEGKGYTAIDLGGMGGLQLADGKSSNDFLIVRKYTYGSLTIYYRLLYQHNSSEDRLSPERITLLIDDQRYILKFLGSDKSDNSEWAWIMVEPPFLEKIADAKTVRLSIEGMDKAIDYVFNKKYLYFFKRFYRECVLPDK